MLILVLIASVLISHRIVLHSILLSHFCHPRLHHRIDVTSRLMFNDSVTSIHSQSSHHYYELFYTGSHIYQSSWSLRNQSSHQPLFISLLLKWKPHQKIHQWLTTLSLFDLGVHWIIRWDQWQYFHSLCSYAMLSIVSVFAAQFDLRISGLHRWFVWWPSQHFAQSLHSNHILRSPWINDGRGWPLIMSTANI